MRERDPGVKSILKKIQKSSIIGPPSFLTLSPSNFRKKQKSGCTRSVRGRKNDLRGLFNYVRLGQVRIAIKSPNIEALGPPINSLACFWTNILK
jgi:hypothetical protein